MNSPMRVNRGSLSVPMLALPASSPLNDNATFCKSRAAANTFSASLSKRAPGAVRTIPVAVRANSASPSLSSSALSCAETAGWLTCSCSAARVSCPSSAMAAKLRNW